LSSTSWQFLLKNVYNAIIHDCVDVVKGDYNYFNAYLGAGRALLFDQFRFSLGVSPVVGLV